MFALSKLKIYKNIEKTDENNIKTDENNIKEDENNIKIDENNKRYIKNVKDKILNILDNNDIIILDTNKFIDKLDYFLFENVYDSNNIPIIILILNIYLENLVKNKNYEIIYKWLQSVNHENMNNTDINNNTVLHILSFFKLKFKKLYVYYKLDILKNYFILNNINTNSINISGFKFTDIDKFEKSKEYIIKIKKTKNKLYLNSTVNENFNKIIKIKKNKINFKEIKYLFNEAKIDKDLTKIIEKFHICVKKNNKIILANNETTENKKKIIKMFIEDNEDVFDLDFFLSKNKL